MLDVSINFSVALSMDDLKPRPGETVVSFARYESLAAAAMAFASCFTPRDRMDISDWRDAAKMAGYDRMVIHDRDCGDAQEVGNFLSVYRSGECWSRWGFARQGSTIGSWCCLTSMDMGQFGSVHEALSVVLKIGVSAQLGSMLAPIRRQTAVVTELAARRKTCIQRLGSAA